MSCMTTEILRSAHVGFQVRIENSDLTKKFQFIFEEILRLSLLTCETHTCPRLEFVSILSEWILNQILLTNDRH